MKTFYKDIATAMIALTFGIAAVSMLVTVLAGVT